MADNLKPEDRIKTMRAVKGKGTRLERRLFAMLAGMRISGWKKNVSTVDGKPDVVFFREKVAIFIDGCFWHGCPICNRVLPKTNHEYWKRKISRNIELAEKHNKNLENSGWVVIRIWEHDIRNNQMMRQIKADIRQALNKEQEQ